MMLATLGTTVLSGVLAAAIALAFDGWRIDRTRRRVGREALQEMQRVLGDLSASVLSKEAVIDETSLEDLTWRDIAPARRAAYPYRDLLRPADRHLVTRSTIPFENYDDLPWDNRQPYVNQWAMDLDTAIEQAFMSGPERLRGRMFAAVRRGN